MQAAQRRALRRAQRQPPEQEQVLRAREMQWLWQLAWPWLRFGSRHFLQTGRPRRAKAAQGRELLAAGQGLIAEPQAQEHRHFRQPQQRAAAWAALLWRAWRAWQPLAAGQKT